MQIKNKNKLDFDLEGEALVKEEAIKESDNPVKEKKRKGLLIAFGLLAGFGVAGTATFVALWATSHNTDPQPQPTP